MEKHKGLVMELTTKNFNLKMFINALAYLAVVYFKTKGHDWPFYLLLIACLLNLLVEFGYIKIIEMQKESISILLTKRRKLNHENNYLVRELNKLKDK
jgi:hypothetical protein